MLVSGFGHSGGHLIPIWTDGGLALLVSGSPGQMGGQSRAAAVFCPTSQILSGGAKSTRENWAFLAQLPLDGVHVFEARYEHMAFVGTWPDLALVPVDRLWVVAVHECHPEHLHLSFLCGQPL